VSPSDRDKLLPLGFMRNYPPGCLRFICNYFGHVKRDISPVANDLRADLDQLFLQARQRPILDRLRRRQRAQKITEIVGQRMKLNADRVSRERAA
jgi:hypothetical protein